MLFLGASMGLILWRKGQPGKMCQRIQASFSIRRIVQCIFMPLGGFWVALYKRLVRCPLLFQFFLSELNFYSCLSLTHCCEPGQLDANPLPIKTEDIWRALQIIHQDGTAHRCLSVLVCICFVCKFSFLLWYTELFHQRTVHEIQGNNTSGFISHFSLVVSGIIRHSVSMQWNAGWQGNVPVHLCINRFTLMLN